MRCNICDKILPSKEIIWEPKYKKFRPCIGCLNSIYDTPISTDTDVGYLNAIDLERLKMTIGEVG